MNLSDKIKCKVPFGTMNIYPESVHLINTKLKMGMVTCGSCVEEFEKEFARKMNSKYAVAVSSGTDANTLACASLYEYGAERGVSEVIIPALTFVATANAVLNAGLKPVFVDVDKETLNIDPVLIEQAITKNTIAIMPVHLMGKPCDMKAIRTIAEKNDLFIIEDCAEAHGAKYRGKKVGNFSVMACYSLYAAHIVSSVEGGMITTNYLEIVNILKSLRNHGMQMNGSNWTFERVGFNSKMNELEACVGLGNISHFRDILTKRRFNLQYLTEKFKKFESWFHIIKEQPHERIGPHAFPIILKDGVRFTKNELVKWYTENGIDNRNLFYSIPNDCPAYIELGYNDRLYTNAKYCSMNGTHIGIHQDLTQEQLDYVVDKTSEFLTKVL